MGRRLEKIIYFARVFFGIHHMSYIGNLKVILSDFVISVQQIKNEKVVETSATQVLILINEAQLGYHGKTDKHGVMSIKISNYITNEIQNCQATVGFLGERYKLTHKKLTKFHIF